MLIGSVLASAPGHIGSISVRARPLADYCGTSAGVWRRQNRGKHVLEFDNEGILPVWQSISNGTDRVAGWL